jgi:glycerol kinase
MYACVDVGTTKIKLAMYDENFEKVHSEYAIVPLTADGLQDPEEVYQTVRQMLKRGKELGAKSAGLATYRASVVAWKKDGTPLTPIVTWMNTDVTKTYARQPLYVKGLAKVPPFDLIISPYSPVIRFLRLKDLRPEIADMFASQSCMAWTLESFLAYRLTGRFVSDATSAALTGLIHPKSFKVIGIVKSMFGLKMPIPEIVGNSELIGSAEGIELRALIADQQAAFLAENVIHGRVAKVTNGTGTFVDIPVEGYSRVKGLVPLVLLKHRETTFYGLEGYLPTSGTAVDKMLNLGILKSYSDLEDDSDSEGVLMVPALAGLQIPRLPRAKGMVYGLDRGTTRNGLISALLKSIAFQVRFVLEASGRRVEALRANGNLSRSTRLLKYISSITGLPVERQKDLEGTMRGLALLQALGLDKLKLDEIDATRSGVEVIEEVEHARYKEGYTAWKRLIGSLRNLER